jgi:hypothetical protein
MTDHLPECWAAPPTPITRYVCICDRLRACEARARDGALYDAAWIPLRGVGVWGTSGRTVLVNAREVRTAILALRSQPISVDDMRRNLAAIDESTP